MRELSPALLATAFAVALAVAPPAAHAGSASDSLTVTATVVSACTVSAATLNFGGSIDPLAAATPVDASSTLTVVCTNTTPYAVSLDAGLNAGGAGNFGSRTMKSGSLSLGYQLYTSAARAVVWGDGTGGSAPVSGTGIGSSQTLTIHGRLPSLSGVAPGTYTDTVTVTISY